MTTHRFSFAMLAGLALAAAASAADVRGVVTKIDPDKKELVVARGLGLRGLMVVFELPDQTPVMVGDQAGTLADVAVGRRVRVQFDVADGKQVVVAIHVLGVPAPPATVVPTVPAPAAPPAAGDGLTGVLRRVGYSDREVVIVGPGAKGAETETVVAVPDAAKITKDGKEATLDDLREGDAATVQVEKTDGQLTAASIQVGPGGPAPTAMDQPGGRVIPRLRRLLQTADQVLQQIEKQTGNR
jgi:Cu/Ag efflux protein CusF